MLTFVTQPMTFVFAGYHPKVFQTANGTSYLQEPGCQLIMQPVVELGGLKPFFDAFDPSLGFGDYLVDTKTNPIPHAAQLCKFAGQGCYAAFGENRRKNEKAGEYLENIRKEKHGSVLEHPQWSFFIYGVSRSLTHELVRHRVGVAFSQLSQRYVDGKVLRFVEGPEYVNDVELHNHFQQCIDQAVKDYDLRAEKLMARILAKEPDLASDATRRRELRKRVNQAARRRLPNEVETWLTFSGNVRALRHILEMRAANAAEVEIRRLGIMMYNVLNSVDPLLFADYQVEQLPDNTQGLATPHRKV